MAEVRFPGLFPWCPWGRPVQAAPAEMVQPYFYTIGLTVTEAVAWFWKPKFWSFAGSSGGVSPFPVSGTLDRFGEAVIAYNEKRLILPEDNGFSQTSPTNLGLFIPDGAPEAIMFGGLIYPRISIATLFDSPDPVITRTGEFSYHITREGPDDIPDFEPMELDIAASVFWDYLP